MPRGVSPVVGTVLAVGITVALAALVAVSVTGVGVPDPAPTATFSASADASTDRITLTHEGGDALSLSALSVRITVEDRSLTHQPPVPFFAAKGFESGPTGPFNSATDDPWTAGETAAVTLASTNNPLLTSGDTVTIEIRHGDESITTVETTA